MVSLCFFLVLDYGKSSFKTYFFNTSRNNFYDVADSVSETYYFISKRLVQNRIYTVPCTENLIYLQIYQKYLIYKYTEIFDLFCFLKVQGVFVSFC